MERGDVAQFFSQAFVGHVVGLEEAAHVPKLSEGTAALVCRIFPPQQFAREFVIQTNHVRFNETLIGLEQRDAIHLDQINVRQEKFGRSIPRGWYIGDR